MNELRRLAIKWGLYQDSAYMPRDQFNAEVAEMKKIQADQVSVDAGWYQQAMKHYCGICEQWFKTASIANHNRFKHKDA